MGTFHLRKGRNITLIGEARKEIIDMPIPKKVALQPPDFRGIKPRLNVKVGHAVKVGTPLISDKIIENLKLVSSASGKVTAINRGDKRALLEIVIETDGKQEAEQFKKFSPEEARKAQKKDIIKNLLDSGLWPIIRQRPFSKIAHPEGKPKSIFIHAMNTEPLAGDVDFILEGQEKDFQLGLDIIGKLTDGDVNLCVATDVKSKALSEAKRVKIHQFSGPHPTGNVSTHIHNVDPINKGDVVWYVEAQDVLRIAQLFLTGQYPVERIVAITGEEAKDQFYAKTIVGAQLAALLKDKPDENTRYISGSVLSGRGVGADGFVCFYDGQITLIPDTAKRELIGWLAPGINKYSFSKTFLSAFMPQKNVSLDVDTRGSHRAIVQNHLYDDYVALDILTYFLIKSVISGDIEEQENLGILECDPEDFALCTFVCPSKTDVGDIIRQGLEIIEKEG